MWIIIMHHPLRVQWEPKWEEERINSFCFLNACLNWDISSHILSLLWDFHHQLPWFSGFEPRLRSYHWLPWVAMADGGTSQSPQSHEPMSHKKISAYVVGCLWRTLYDIPSFFNIVNIIQYRIKIKQKKKHNLLKFSNLVTISSKFVKLLQIFVYKVA